MDAVNSSARQIVDLEEALTPEHRADDHSTHDAIISRALFYNILHQCFRHSMVCAVIGAKASSIE